MGLGDMIPDDGENEPSSGDENGGTDKKYVRPTREDMEEFFRKRPETYKYVDVENTKELVFETEDFLFLTPHIVLRVFSTVDERSGKARDKGSDAIRTVVWDKNLDHPVGGRTKTLRIKTWRKNLNNKIDDLMASQSDYVQRCPQCNDFMVIRSGKYGDFWGCRNYPDCEETAQIPD